MLKNSRLDFLYRLVKNEFLLEKAPISTIYLFIVRFVTNNINDCFHMVNIKNPVFVVKKLFKNI